ncbi:MAG TPA: cell division protein FtsQ/DivIB [Alphaproteobacteria bacterium]|nr:cell division protein FtsQ/DivIB [Alphaproteobacteria bacterium]
MRQVTAPSLPAAKPRWRRPTPRWLGAVVRYGGAALLATLVCVAGAWVWRSGTAERTLLALLDAGLQTTSGLGLRVGDVMVEGRHETTAQELLAALGAKRGAPLLGLDLGAARERLESLPWVRAASVERRWPSLVFVTIEERTPLALWQSGGRIKLVDREGKVIEGADVARFAQLPMVVGEGAPKQAPAFLDMLAKVPELARHVESGIWVGNRRWNLHLNEGIDVRLPEINPDEALQRLADLDAKERLFERDIVLIDLRLPDRLIVRLSPDAAARQGKPGKNT